MKPFININQIPLEDWQHGKDYQAKLGSIGKLIGAKQLGYRLVILPPGKKAWPKHAHFVNEEMFFILQGCGTLKMGDNSYSISQGDIIAAPAMPELAHQITNTGSEDLHYLAVSTMKEPDIVHCPNSNKIGIMAGSPPGGDKSKRSLTAYFSLDSVKNYWSGEG